MAARSLSPSWRRSWPEASARVFALSPVNANASAAASPVVPAAMARNVGTVTAAPPSAPLVTQIAAGATATSGSVGFGSSGMTA